VPAVGSGESSEWARKAQSFLTSLCEQVGAETTNAELLKIVTAWPTDALAQILDGTPAASLLATGGDRYLVSVRNNLAEKLASWKYGKSGNFSLRSYMTSDDPRWLWLPYRDMEHGVQGPAIATWIDILVLSGLERAEQSGTQRTWIIIDELDSIGVIGGLKEAVTRLRKSNVAVVAAIQDLNQLVERYGRETAQTLFGCFSNRLYLRCGTSELAEKVAKELGEAEFEETRTQTARSLNRQSQSRTSKGENTSLSSQYTRSPVQLATEIRNLPTRTGFVTFAGINQVMPINLSVGR
jgi:type IV secretory pathway TraG/TraD family ATPase VirD4